MTEDTTYNIAKTISLTTCISKQLKSLNFRASCQFA